MDEMTRPNPPYEPPAIDELDITQGPVETAPGITTGPSNSF